MSATPMRLVGYAFARSIRTEHTGGNCRVDLIELANGKVLGIDSEVAVLYPDMKSFADGVDASDFPTMKLYDEED